MIAQRIPWLGRKRPPPPTQIVLAQPEEERKLILTVHRGRKRLGACMGPDEASNLSRALARWVQETAGARP